MQERGRGSNYDVLKPNVVTAHGAELRCFCCAIPFGVTVVFAELAKWPCGSIDLIYFGVRPHP